MRKILLLFFAILLISTNISFAQQNKTEQLVQEDDAICTVYFTGIGCPHCAVADPVVLEELVEKYPNLIIIEYEIYQQRENAALLYAYNTEYDSGFGIPLIIFNNDLNIIGDRPIVENIKKILDRISQNDCPLQDRTIPFNQLDINTLPGRPKIWKDDRVLIAKTGGRNSNLLRSLLLEDNISIVLASSEYEIVEPEPVALSGKNIDFKNAIKVDGWLFQWNSEEVPISKCPVCPEPSQWSFCVNNTKTRTNYKCSKETNYECIDYTEFSECDGKDHELTLTKILSLAAVDAVNPCALAVLSLMLIAIITYNPRKKRRILLAGLAFTVSVFIMYLIYGLVIIKFFQVIQALTSIRLILYKAIAIVAVVLGLLNIKDYLFYKPGSALTEMPLKLRPIMKKLISGVTSPRGAFVVGLFVTVFLLPCTIGPYIIAGGILSAMELFATLPLLLIYNFVFVLPMLAITLVVYGGFAKVEDVSGWKERNIKYLHLIAGIIMFLLGIAMFGGFI